MTPQERELIESVFSRLAQVAGAAKDPEAVALIAERMRALPDAPYGLVQAVVFQEMALKQAQTRVAELEQRLAQGGSAAASGGGFLGGGNPWAAGSAPRGPSEIPSVPMQPQYASQPQYQAAPPPPQAPSPWAQPSPAGGFLRSAATTAAGVAGGMLLAEGVAGLFGGHHGGFGGVGPWGAGGAPMPSENVENVVVNNYYGDNGQPADGSGDAAAAGDDYAADYSDSSGGGDFFGGDSGGDDGQWT